MTFGSWLQEAEWVVQSPREVSMLEDCWSASRREALEEIQHAVSDYLSASDDSAAKLSHAEFNTIVRSLIEEEKTP